MLSVPIIEWGSWIEHTLEHGMQFSGREEGYLYRFSLREALNLARYNPFSLLGKFGPLWGKAQALENVEKKLNIQ